MNDMPLVSLILVTYNSAALLPTFFASLATTIYEHYEIIVVDNASRDDTLRYLAERQPRVRIVANATNQGFGRACNAGVCHARGNLLVFLNPDVTFTPEWLTLLVQHSAGNPKVGILCPTTLYPGQQCQPGGEPLRETAAVPGCAMMVPLPAWQALGGFDEHIFLYWEDTELCWRAWLLGWKVAADTQACVYHQRGGSGGANNWDAERMKNSLYTYLKLMRWRRVLPFAALLLSKTVVKLARRPRRDVLAAWTWNATHLADTLRERRRLAGANNVSSARLEQMIDVYQREQAHERRARRGRGAPASA